jgi:3-oxoacyl-[acyl-carrier-protein] synthase-1
MQQAMETVDGPIDYVNTHGTSTPVGDTKELEALKTVFTDKMPYISATKSLSGHALGAAGVHEAIYSLIMMKERFLAASANIKDLDPAALGLPILVENMSQKVRTIMSNSFGFGGTNATLVFQDI